MLRQRTIEPIRYQIAYKDEQILTWASTLALSIIVLESAINPLIAHPEEKDQAIPQ